MIITKIIENSEKKYFRIYIKYEESLMWSEYTNSDYDLVKEYAIAIGMKYKTFYHCTYEGEKEIDLSSPDLYSKITKFICIVDNHTSESLGYEGEYKFDSEVVPKGVEWN